MNVTPDFGYLQARIQARYAERPDEPVWVNLEQTGDFGRYLQQVKATGMKQWVEKLGANSDAHEIERSLRQVYRSHVEDVAGWAPDHWRAAILWFRVLIDLERLHAVMNGQVLPDWIADDANEPSAGDVDDWRGTWRTMWPPLAGRERDDLRVVEELLPVASHEAIPMEKMDRTFRRCSRHPAGTFSWLVLTLGDVMRLRGGLVRRKLFGGGN